MSYLSNTKEKAQSILGSYRPELAKEFTNDNQITALEILGNKKAEIALEFSNPNQIDALYIFGAQNYELALQYTKRKQIDAIEILGSPHYNTRIAQKFTNLYQVEALRILTSNDQVYKYLKKFRTKEVTINEKAKIALEFSNHYQFIALDMIGPDNAKLALKFSNQFQLDALELLGYCRTKYDTALLVSGGSDEVLRKDCKGDKHSDQMHFKKNELSIHNKAKLALQFTNECHLNILKKFGPNKITFAANVLDSSCKFKPSIKSSKYELTKATKNSLKYKYYKSKSFNKISNDKDTDSLNKKDITKDLHMDLKISSSSEENFISGDSSYSDDQL